MANVLFKRGLQAALPAANAAEDGVFYLTQDTNRLYVGQGTNLKLLNQTVQFVDNVAALGALTTQWGASASSHVNDFYYVTGSNILAVYTGTGPDSGWVQINPDTNTTNQSMTIATAAAANVGTVTATVTDSHGDSVSDDFTITGAGSVHVTNNNGLVLTGDKYSLDKEVANDGASATLKLVSDSGVAADNSEIRLTSSDSSVLNFSATSTGVQITAHNTTLGGSASTTITANNGTLGVTVTDDDGNDAAGTLANVGVVLNDGSYAPLTASAAGTSAGQLYSKAEIDTMMKGLDGMSYKGTLGSTGATASVLPSSNVSNGDTYVIVESGATTSSAIFNGATFETNTSAEMANGTKVGDMVIAKGTEGSNGYISGTITWTYIPAGNDSLADVTYSATVNENNHAISLSNENGTGLGKIALVAGTDVVLSSTKTTDTGFAADSTLTTTINHATITTTPTTGSAVDGAASFSAITGITYNNGHITGYTTQTYSPVTYDLEGAEISQTNVVNGLTNSGLNDADVEIKIADSQGNYGTSAHLKLESSSIKLTPGSGANADKLTMNFEWGSF